MSTSTAPQGVSSTGYLIVGSLLSAIAAIVVLAASSESNGADGLSALGLFGILIGFAGGAMLAIGLIAKGVALGMEEHRRSL